MFYSQFILAKKGPLGTIWIAAHLERKLRKNQVADTDIGISVDSILSPDVPIALRLSSHLLLGVVRIYSRKVNYLFHDCSEALLKIKEAFRSTAVDLPPEESTAPYHSITLPETFDLDDFELPDSAFLQGNFDDHHVSTREQITLQDSVDGTGFSTSQFGLDERFGDGDASQIRFELDEDLFLDKNPLPQHASALSGTDEGAVQQSDPSIPLADMDIDEGQNGHDVDRVPETSKDLSELLSNDCDKFVISSVDNLKRNNASSHRHGYNIQTPDLNEVFSPNDHTDGPSAVPSYVAFADDDPPSPDLFECAQAPSTPGLMEEAIPANVQQIPALSPQGKTSSSDAVEVINKDTSISLEFEGPDATNNIPIIVASMGPELVDNAQVLSSPTSDLMEQKLDSLEPDNSVGVLATTDNLGGVLAAPDEVHLGCGQKNEDNLQSGYINNEINNLLIVHDSIKAIHPEVTCLDDLSSNLETPLSKPASDNVHEASNLETPLNKPTADDVHPEVTCIGSLLTVSCSHEASYLEMPLNKSTVYNVHPEVTHVDGLLTSSCSHEASDLATPLDKPTADDVVIMTSNDDVLMPGMTLDINSTSLGSKTVPSIFVNQDYVKHMDSCFPSNTLECSSELYLRSCNFQLNHANVLSSQVATLVGNAPEFSHRELTCNSEAPLREEAFYVSGSSIGLQGEDNYTGSVTDNVQEVHQKADLVLSEFKSGVTKPDDQLTGLISKNIQLDHQKADLVLSEFKSGVTKPDDQLTGLISKNIQLDNLHCYSSSDYPEPEKMLFASTGYSNLQHDFGQFTADKGITESAGSVDRISSLSGKKRRLMDSTPVLQIGSSAKISGLPRVRKNNAYLPEDDDILASILVGRAQNLIVGPTPPPPRTTPRKRPRLTHKSGMPKRKVLLDDTMVLHADAIRQQLMNTEDIRRIRKKAPCTRPEIWTIHKSSMDEELFSESLFIGISTELGSLHTRRYDVNENLGPQIGKHHSDEQYFDAELSKEMEHSRSVELVRETSGREIGDLIAVMPDKDVGGMQEPSGTSVSIEVQSYVDAQEKLEFHPPQVEPSGNNQSVTVSTVGINVHESVGTEMPLLSASHSGNELEISTGFRIEETFIHINNNTHTSPEKSGALSIHQEQESPNELVQPSDKLTGMGDKTFNFTGNASVDNITSAEEATRCSIVDSKVFAAVNDDTLVQDEDTSIAKDTHIFEVGNVVDVADLNCNIVDSKVFAAVNDDTLVRNEDTSIAKGTHILEEGNVVDVAVLNCTQDYRDVGKIENGEILVSMLDRCLLEDREGLPADSSTVIGHVNSPTVDMAVKSAEPTELAMTSNAAMDRCLLEDREGLPAESSTVIGHANSPTVDMSVKSAEPTELAMTSNAAMEESKEDRSEVAPEGGHLVDRVSADEERPTSEILCSESPQVTSSCAYELNNGTENVPSAVGENSGLQECNLQCGFDAESVPMDLAAARESSDFCSAIDGNDTEFLSVDDEADFDEEADNDLPNPEEAQSPENSGWSTRTRGVARYLKTLFDEEYGRGRKVVTVDHLLAGKTRKEASRMFFETLVLKTRDYIHVEQENPFDCINIKPRPKLLKVGIPTIR